LYFRRQVNPRPWLNPAVGYPPMLLMEADGDIDGDMDGDMPLMDGDGEVPGICMSIGDPPMPMLWWIATHQFHTSVCTGPAT
jgi:hypothetical protein